MSEELLNKVYSALLNQIPPINPNEGDLFDASVDAIRIVVEECAKVAEGFQHNREWVPGSLYDTLRKETAADIRKLAEDGHE